MIVATPTPQSPLPSPSVLRAVARCAGRTAVMLAARHIHLPRGRVGMRLRFADGTSSVIYRETVVDRPEPAQPCLLVVTFRLRMVHGRGHRAFRWESVLNTPLFVGFPGFVSKLWLAHDQQGRYRGIYEWDGAGAAVVYARALWGVLAVVSAPGSIRYAVLPEASRDELLAGSAEGGPGDWWRVTTG